MPALARKESVDDTSKELLTRVRSRGVACEVGLLVIPPRIFLRPIISICIANPARCIHSAAARPVMVACSVCTRKLRFKHPGVV